MNVNYIFNQKTILRSVNNLTDVVLPRQNEDIKIEDKYYTVCNVVHCPGEQTILIYLNNR